MSQLRSGASIFLLAVSTLFAAASDASAQAARLVICSNSSTGAIAIRSGRCRATESRIQQRSQLVGAVGPQGAAGAQGAAGPQGAAGANGSAGAAGSAGATLELLSDPISLLL
jgi:hypothetical protein